MALPRLADLTPGVETFFAAAWRAVQTFAAALRIRPHVPPFSSATVPAKQAALPTSYGRTRLVALAVDPYAVHVYWEITPATLAEAGSRMEETIDQAQAVLRFRETPFDAALAGSAGHWFDIEIQLVARNWYVPLWAAAKTYDTEIGFRTRSGTFVFLARAKRIQTPRAWPEPNIKQHFIRVSGQERHTETVSPPEHSLEYSKEPVKVSAALQSVVSPSTAGASTRPMDPVQILERKYAAITPPSGRQDAPGKVEDAREYQDMSETAEKRFVAGISSILLQRAER